MRGDISDAWSDIGPCAGDSGAALVKYTFHPEKPFYQAIGMFWGSIRTPCRYPTNSTPGLYANARVDHPEILSFIVNAKKGKMMIGNLYTHF